VRAPRWSVLAIIVVALLLLLGRALAGVYAGYRWYAAMGAASVWETRTTLTLVLYLISGSAAAALVFANLYAVRRSVVSLVLPRRVANIEIGEEVPGRYLVTAALLLSLLLGAILTLPSTNWLPLALARHGLPFGETDPYFEADLGFFVYWLPFENALYIWALIAVLAVTALVVFLYALTPSLRWERGSLYVSNYVRRHLVVLGCLMLLVLAWSYRLDAYKALIGGSGPEGAYTFSDQRATVPVDIWLSVITGAAAFVVLFFGWTGQMRAAFVAVSAVLVLALGLRQLGPPVARRFADVPNAAERELPYRQMRADYTRRAYALDRITANDSLTYMVPHDAVGSVSVWDPLALQRALLRLRWLEGVPRGVGWEPSGAGLVATVLDGSDEASDDGVSQEPWRVLRIRAGEADAMGNPVAAGAIGATLTGDGTTHQGRALPPVLFADSVPGYAIITDTLNQVAAPDLGSGLSRLAHAWALQNFRLLSGEVGRNEVKVLTHRGVRERVHGVAPFFVQGGTILPVVAADSLYWVVDLYTASPYYPVSEHVLLGSDEYGYVHHAGSGIVNAHTGRTTILMDPAPDPVARSWMRIFPELFAGAGGLPPAVLEGLPPAVDATRIQAQELARYGMRGTEPPLGHLPWNIGADSVLRADAVGMLLLPNGALAWSQPVLDSTDRVTGLVAGTGGRGGATYWIPFHHVEARWNSLLDQLHRAVDSTATPAVPRDARLVRGTARTVPVAHGIALVQPAYAWKTDGPPLLVRVGVGRDSVVTTGRTLAEALGVLSPGAADTSAVAPREFRALVEQLYDQMHDALTRGDWAAFGRAYDELGRIIARARR
jgi:uncharacterized membrane protein (UPF0182 family)